MSNFFTSTESQRQECPSQVDSVARNLTTSAEHGDNISKELNAMSPAERVQVAHKMEEYNRSDMSKDGSLPRLSIYFNEEFSDSALNTLQKTHPTLKNDEHLAAIQVQGSQKYVYDNGNVSDEISRAQMDKLISPEMRQKIAQTDERRQALVDDLAPQQRKTYEAEKEAKSFYLRTKILLPKYTPQVPFTPLYDSIERLSNPDTVWD